MKKACLTMRQRQMDELSKKGNLPVSMLAKLSPNGGLPPARSKAPVPARKVMKRSPDAAPGRAAPAPKILDLFTQEIKVRCPRSNPNPDLLDFSKAVARILVRLMLLLGACVPEQAER